MPRWARLAVGIAVLRSALALTLYLSIAPQVLPRMPMPLWVYAVLSSTFTVLGLGLMATNRRDDRCLWLGGIFTLIGTPLAMPLVGGRASLLVPWLAYVRPEALLGPFLWQFLLRFPSDLKGRSAILLRGLTLVSGVVGVGAFAVNLVAAWMGADRLQTSWAALFVANWPGSLFWLVILSVAVPALPVLLWRAWTAGRDERRQVLVFVGALIAGFAPFGLELLVESAFPAYKAFAHSPDVEPWIGTVIFGATAIVPFVTSYSVLFDRVFDVRVVLRAALQYALARYTIVGTTLVPFCALVVLLFDARNESLAALLVSGPRPLLLGGVVALGATSFRLRARWLEALDRRYFREHYDARQILTRFVGELPATQPPELGQRIRDELDRALHADVEVFLADDERTLLKHVDNSLPALGLTSTLTGLAINGPGPMDVDLADPRAPWHRLPEEERQWLQRGNLSLIVAIRRAGGGAAGLLALAPKRSGLPYSVEDRRLLVAVASAAGLALDSLRLRSTPEPPPEPAARECLQCSRLSPFQTTRCVCGGELAAAAVPHVLRGVFRLEQRVGAGGMGVVYRAVDLNLGRDVAIKALLHVTPEYAQRLRREARAMAAVTHPNLAVIYGVETWRSTPFLVQEYLAGGTLAQRLAGSRLEIGEALDLVLTLAGLLEYLHRHGVVHCDIKPSNIAFTQGGVVKLLDFGLARLLRDVHAGADSTTSMGVRHTSATRGSSVNAFGTPPFMSPEAIRGERPAPSFDLWALAVVLFEALAGCRPFDGADSFAIAARILSGPPPDIREFRPEVPDSLAGFFSAALAADPGARPTSATAFASVLRRLPDSGR